MSNPLNEITEQIIGASIEVHKTLGPGLLESAYEQCLSRELSLRKMEFDNQVELPVEYKGVKLNVGYRIDLLVMDQVVVEIKAVDKVLAVHEAQLMTYMKLSGKSLGLLLNFNVPALKDGITRRIL